MFFLPRQINFRQRNSDLKKITVTLMSLAVGPIPDGTVNGFERVLHLR